jgi:CRP/FNR family transcriptional regulator
MSKPSPKSSEYVECRDCALDPICHPAFTGTSLFSDASFNDFFSSYVLDHVERRKAVTEGSAIYRQNEPVTALYAVTSGAFKLLSTSTTGQSQLTGFRFPGELLGDEALAVGCHPVTAIAISEASVCVIPLQVIRNINAEMPRFQQAFLTLIIQQCYLAHQQLADYVALKSADQKLAAFLLHLIKRISHSAHDKNSLLLPMSRTDIASYLGLRHETLSRSFSKFQQQGLIEIRSKQIHFSKPDKLQALASGAEISL